MAEILKTGAGIVRAELPHLEATVNDIRANPSNAAFDILEFLKGLWSNITTSGIIPMIVNKVKEWIQSLMAATKGNGPSTSREEVLPLLSSFLSAPAAPIQTTQDAAAPSVTIPIQEQATTPALVPTSVPVHASKPVAAPASLAPAAAPAAAAVTAPVSAPAQAK